ncbi:MAG: hypothetical protein QXJ48_00340 [Candidatus Korarchaeum sp.]
MEKGRKEARVGLDSEKDIIHRINFDVRFGNLLKECLNRLGFDIEEEIKAQKIKNVKTDILIKIDDEIGVSIKSSTRTSFHHLDRRRLENWKDLLNMPNDVFNIIKEAILRVAENPRNVFILERDRPGIRGFFTKYLKDILKEIFIKGEENLKILMINDKQNRKIYVFKISDVIDFIYRDAICRIDFSEKGIIRLGDFITIQRKGGNGKHVTIPKTNWEHPGNQLQFKFSPLKFVECIRKANAIEFCTISY